MRESIGATWIFSICLTFIILFTAYLAISVNYAKAFRIKSELVTMIEQNEGYSSGMEQELETYLISNAAASGDCPFDSYNTSGVEVYDGYTLVQKVNSGTSGKYLACIYRQGVTGLTNTEISSTCGAYYKVVVFFKFDLPVVNYLTTFKISGETKYIIKDVYC